MQYVSPALTLEASLELRVTPTVAFTLGLLLWADNASIAGTNDVAASSGRQLYAASGAPQPIETPQYHLATGPQVFLGPQLGMQFGPDQASESARSGAVTAPFSIARSRQARSGRSIK